VSAMGGTVRVASELGTGTTFRVTLPRAARGWGGSGSLAAPTHRPR
jgi:hypothetical protein